MDSRCTVFVIIHTNKYIKFYKRVIIMYAIFDFKCSLSPLPTSSKARFIITRFKERLSTCKGREERLTLKQVPQILKILPICHKYTNIFTLMLLKTVCCPSCKFPKCSCNNIKLVNRFFWDEMIWSFEL